MRRHIVETRCSTSLQHRHRPFSREPFPERVRIVDNILINIVVEGFPFVLPTPSETFVCGVKNKLAPTVVDEDLEILNLVLRPLGKGKNVVQPVGPGGGDGIGQIQGDVRHSHHNGHVDNTVTAIYALEGN